MHNLSGMGLIITGSTGIGAATARLAAAAGARVVVISRDEATVKKLYDELKPFNPGGGGFVADLTQEADVIAAVSYARRRLGRIDALFNVAGISGRRFGDGPLHECTVAGWETTLDHNAKTTFLMCRTVLRRMLRQPLDVHGLRGALLNMSSVLDGSSPEPKHFATHAYAASKAAITGMSRSMAAYYAKYKIRVNVIAPALVATPMSARAQSDDEILHYLRGKQPLGETMLTPQDVAQTALFLLSPAARRITGQTVTVDAGWSVTNE